MRFPYLKYLLKSVTNVPEQRAIKAIFKDGSQRLFPYVWLRDCSLDDKTYVISDAMKGRLHTMRDFDVNIEPISFRANSSNLIVEWPGNVVSRYKQKWLRTHCPGSKEVIEKRRQIYLGRECIRLWENGGPTSKNRFQFSHQSFLEDDKVLHDFLKSVCVDGIAVLRGQEYGSNLRNEVFSICPKPDASNMAYANTGELPYHTDFPSLQDPPQLQLLHMCKQSECGGGKSMFVDGFSIAKEMSKYPKEYQILCDYPLEFIEEGFDVHNVKGFQDKEERVDFSMVARHKTFKTDNSGLVQVQFGNVMRSWFLDMVANDPLLVQNIYNSLKLFNELCYLPENQLIFSLNSGDTVLWANTRILHARTSYNLIGIPERERHLLGCYFSWDTIKSKVRLIRRKLKLEEDQETL
uniref:TauD/TfdA-like domain-containing protein n=1 Tax=Meloidogyne javanica TaxID=6303 RepID=A0A915LGG4_MELJA